MATTSVTKDKKKAGKNSNKSKVGDDNPSIDITSEEVLMQPDMSIANKLDKLLEVVKDMDGKLKEQELRLQKQEERVSLNEISALPSAQSSPKVAKNSEAKDSAKLPSFEDLKSDSRVQAEVDKRLREYQHMSRGDSQGKPNTALKSGRFRSGAGFMKSLSLRPVLGRVWVSNLRLLSWLSFWLKLISQKVTQLRLVSSHSLNF